MKSVITVAVLMALFVSHLAYAQNDTPMEVLVNIAYENERFSSFDVFAEDDRNTQHLDPYLEKYIALKLDERELERLLSEAPTTASIMLPFHNGEKLKLKIVNHDIRSDAFAIVDQNEETLLSDFRAEFYRGVILDSRDASVGISFFDNDVYGIFSSKDKGNIVLVKDPIHPGDGNNFILYSEEDLKIERKTNCSADLLTPSDDFQTSTSRSNVYSTCDDVEVYVESTLKLLQAKGSMSTTTQFILAFFNNSSIIYRNEGIYTSIKTIKINTAEDGYSDLSSSKANLNKFGDNTRNKYQQYGAELAHLVDYNEEGLGGIAWINALCNNYFYFQSTKEHYGAYAYSSVFTSQENFPDYSLTVFMFAHEMGHNLGSLHTQSCTWEGGPIDNCANVEEGSCDPGPTPTNGGTIMSYCHTKPSIGINFSNGFGQQPGDLIRSNVSAKQCIESYEPGDILPTSPNLIVTANRECSNESGWTNYFFDNNTSDEGDDLLVLSVKKEGENIGNLNDGTLIVRMMTSSQAGNGSTHIIDPGYDLVNNLYVMNRWFDLKPTKEPLNPVTVRFPYTDEDLEDVQMNQSQVKDHNDLVFYKINNPGNPNPDGGHSDVSNEDITFYTNDNSASLTAWKYVRNSESHFAEFKVSSFSGGGGGFAEAAESALPVSLHSFEVLKQDEYVSLEWATALEINNDYFEVERSADGRSFEKIGRIKGAGTSSEREGYSFLDRNPSTGLNYYRLSQTDFDGSHENLGVRAIDFRGAKEVSVFPNPISSGVLSVQFESKGDITTQIVLRNIEGKIIQSLAPELSKGENLIELNIGDIDSGIYLLQVITESEIYTQKIVKD